MNEFKTYHPIVNFTYFLFVIGFSMFFMHPVCLLISLISAFSYSVLLNGKRAVKFNLLYMLPLIIVTALLNPAFNHQGVTILTYFPSGNPLTLESVMNGMAAALMLGSVILWFSCYNFIMTSDKFIYLFGKIIPSLSLIISMVLRFVPRFKTQLFEVSAGQRCIGRDVSNGTLLERVKNGIRILSIMVTWSLENAIDTADSMKSRGYGLKNRTAYSNFRFTKRDMSVLAVICVLGIYVLAGAVLGCVDYQFVPYMRGTGYSPYTIPVFAAYFILCMTPVIIEAKEEIAWKLLKSKI
ncbi:MAG: energy-coupling factor transporter transmembrane component T [Clostridia bacterium]|nr:energy-coupling factor transporter transmembrane component T [Clostridia bacterium]